MPAFSFPASPTDTPMDQLNAMRAFRRVVELGGFARAADDLGVSAAGLSKQLRQLEEHLGTVLLQRTTRRMSLTDAGQAYFAECRRLLDDMERVERQLRAQAGQVEGRLRVNAPTSFGLAVLSPLLGRFLARHPRLKLDLVLDDRLLDVIGAGFDVSLRVRSLLEDSSLVARRLGTVQQFLCASPDYLAQRGTPGAPVDLQQHDVLAYALADTPDSWSLQGPEGTTRVALPPARTVVNNSLMLRDLLCAGLGIGALPSFLASPAIADGRLRRVLPECHYPSRQVYAIYPTTRHLPPKVQMFVDFLAEALPALLETDS